MSDKLDLGPLYNFSASSANDHLYKQLWIDGAGKIFDQLNTFAEMAGYSPKVVQITDFENADMDNLKAIFNNNRSDKASTHNYYIFYSHVFNSLGKDNKLNVLEIGIGTNNPSLISTMDRCGRPGASLYSWDQYLPSANIYGADVDSHILFNTPRIKTAYVDQMNIDTFTGMTATFGNPQYDVIIDDGLHSIAANLNTLLFGLKNVKPNGWVIIEDIRDIKLWHSIDFMLKQAGLYETIMIKSKSAYMYAVHRKE